AVLLSGLWYVQIVSAGRFRESLENQQFRTVRMPAVRGKIFDRNGLALADNQPSYTISLYLEDLREQFQQEYRREKAGRRLSSSEQAALSKHSRFHVASNLVQIVATQLQQPLVLNETRFQQHYEQRLALPMPVLENLTPTQVARFLETSANYPGIKLQIQPLRLYPAGTVAAHVLGYLRRDDSSSDDEDAYFNYRLPDYKGVVGIEGALDRELRGHAGGKSMLVKNLGYQQSENVWTAPQPGQNVVLTLDLPIQIAAEQALHSAGPNTRGAIVVLDPTSGDVLAMASSPSYDPSQFSGRLAEEDLARLNDPHLRPMMNRATQERYPPGSIFKIIVGLAAMEAGVLNTNDVVFNPGFYPLGRRKFIDVSPHGNHNFRSAFKYSSNCYFIYYGIKAGPDRIVEMAQRFFLGQRTGILPRQETAGEIPSLDDVLHNWFDG